MTDELRTATNSVEHFGISSAPLVRIMGAGWVFQSFIHPRIFASGGKCAAIAIRS